MKLIELNCQQYGRIYANVDKIDTIYEANGGTKIYSGGLIWDIEDPIEHVIKLIGSEPVQDGIKSAYRTNADVKKKIDDLTDMDNLNGLNLRSE